MPERIYEIVGRRIRELRKSQKLSLEALSARASLTASYLGQVERAERKPSLLTVNKIAAALDVSPASFYSDERNGVGLSEAPWAKRLLEMLEGLPSDHRAILLDAMTFVVRRQRRQARRAARPAAPN